MREFKDIESQSAHSKLEQKSIDFSVEHEDQNAQRLQKSDTKAVYGTGLPEVHLYERDDTGTAVGALAGHEAIVQEASIGNPAPGSSNDSNDVTQENNLLVCSPISADGSASIDTSGLADAGHWIVKNANPLSATKLSLDAGIGILQAGSDALGWVKNEMFS